MDVYDQDSNLGPDDMNAKMEADVKIEVESDAEEEDGENTVSATSDKSLKQELVKPGLHLLFFKHRNPSFKVYQYACKNVILFITIS